MEKYMNLGGGSNVLGYEIGTDFIKVQFSSGNPYVYTHASAGVQNVETMKALAKRGSGLNSFIMTNCKMLYDPRLSQK